MSADDRSAPLPQRPASLKRLDRSGAVRRIGRAIAIEAPVSIEYNGIAYAVMMASPADIEDFVTGFSLSEGVIGSPADIIALEVAEIPLGWVARVILTPECGDRVLDRARNRVSEGSCGLCGLENLEQVMRPLPAIDTVPAADAPTLFRALDGLAGHQPLSRSTGAVHAAAFCSSEGAILMAREDIGRHNALDKLVGALARQGTDPRTGFFLLTARCSYELVEKTVLARCPLLVTISAPSSLAIDRAAAHGLTLVALARPDAMLAAHDPHALFG
ncbi:sulfurtransferase FdhD [Sphingobium jiangsuense]|uniref:Sulfur carrier protein FdhD n=1 Tax=Sphingobium jiangsuense TaxID=870476 RepID=A0A7W6BFS5_9SPHN|nr:formate dehydrogenase accessory sulfurtransferase FdhD [Sphingobium jiangsuense]MBB3925234.1 FdhD protein [Sphingobium jiangsuense]GLT00619.1 sulfurtransferase FdhD [Sphingobium jiangsuense]